MTQRGSQIDQVRERLTRWRMEHGGRGQRIPQELWAQAAALAGSEGVDATARALGVDRGRLARRVAMSPGPGGADDLARASEAFVEMDADQVIGQGVHRHVIVRVVAPDGVRLEVELPIGASAADVIAMGRGLVRATR